MTRGLKTAILLAAAAGALAHARPMNDPYPDPGDKKVYYTVMSSGGLKGLDPCQAGDTTSGTWCAQFYDALYEYHYLKRPFELKPALAEAMPEVSDDGLVWTIRMKKGVLFHNDACFPDGQGREATVHDIIYAFKRTADPANDPRWWWMLRERIEGLDEFHERAVEMKAQNKRVDYDVPVAGLAALDDHTLRIRLTEPFPQLAYVLAMGFPAAVPREAVEHYGKDFLNHPVGTPGTGRTAIRRRASWATAKADCWTRRARPFPSSMRSTSRPWPSHSPRGSTSCRATKRCPASPRTTSNR